jgi:hydrogenase expression/formation protein HypC
MFAEVVAMCIGIPGQIITISERTAVVDCWGTRRNIRLNVLEDDVVPGDYVIDHAGFALRRIPTDEVADTLAMYETILSEAEEDPIVTDLLFELESFHELN